MLLVVHIIGHVFTTRQVNLSWEKKLWGFEPSPIAPGSQFAIGQTELICQARDVFGNRVDCTFNIEIKGKYELT